MRGGRSTLAGGRCRAGRARCVRERILAVSSAAGTAADTWHGDDHVELVADGAALRERYAHAYCMHRHWLATRIRSGI